MRHAFTRSCAVVATMFIASCDDDDTLGPSSTVEAVAVIPSIFSMIVGDTLRLSIIARGEVGNPITGLPVVWETSSASVLTVSESGLVAAVGSGAANITATAGGRVGTAAVAVSPRFGAAAFTSVTAGGGHTCALTANGRAYCWGRDDNGQLGVAPPSTICLPDQGPSPCGLVPFPVDGGLSFTQLTAGEAHTCGLTSDGSAWCWGSNSDGQLGDGSFTSRHAPVAVSGALKFASIEAGDLLTCGVTTTGAVWCWGANSKGQLGDGTTTRRSTPVTVTAPAGVFFQQVVSGGSDHRDFTCALTVGGNVYCWGDNDRGQLGRGTFDLAPHPTPAPVVGALMFTSIAAGFGDHTCGITSTGSTHCWGGNTRGELGDGSNLDSYQPLAVSGGTAFQKMSIGGGFIGTGFTCGLTSAGVAWCWGENYFGSLGDGSTVNSRRAPVRVTGGQLFESVSAGHQHACGRTLDGTVYCWGSGRTGQCGNNYAFVSRVPVKVFGQP